jgi:hypothetical protein
LKQGTYLLLPCTRKIEDQKMMYGTVQENQIIFPIETNEALGAYHIPFHSFCDGFFDFVDVIAPFVGFFTREGNRPEGS